MSEAAGAIGPRQPCDVIIGGLNQITRYLLPCLLAASERNVVVVSRSAAPPWCPDNPRVSWLHGGLESFRPAQPSALNGLFYLAPLSLFGHLSEQLKPRHVVAMSSTSVETKVASTSARERAVAAALREGEEAVIRYCDRHDIAWTILRPALIYGCGMDASLTSVAQWIRRYGFLILPGRPTGLRQPVHAQDVAQAAAEALRASNAKQKTYVLSGGTVLSYEAMLSAVFLALGKRRRIVTLPAALVKCLVRIAALLPTLRHLDPAMVERFREDLVFDHAHAARDLGFNPRPFAPDSSCFVP